MLFTIKSTFDCCLAFGKEVSLCSIVCGATQAVWYAVFSNFIVYASLYQICVLITPLVLIKHQKILLLCLWSYTNFEHEMIRRVVIGTIALKQELAVKFLMLVGLTSCCIQDLQHILSSVHY